MSNPVWPYGGLLLLDDRDELIVGEDKVRTDLIKSFLAPLRQTHGTTSSNETVSEIIWLTDKPSNRNGD